MGMPNANKIKASPSIPRPGKIQPYREAIEFSRESPACAFSSFLRGRLHRPTVALPRSAKTPRSPAAGP